MWFNTIISIKLPRQVDWKQVDYHRFICQENRLNMILDDLLRWTFPRSTATRTKPTPQSSVRRPHVAGVIGPFFPVWCTAVVSGSVPTPDYTTTRDKGPAQSDTTELLRPK